MLWSGLAETGSIGDIDEVKERLLSDPSLPFSELLCWCRALSFDSDTSWNNTISGSGDKGGALANSSFRGVDL